MPHIRPLTPDDAAAADVVAATALDRPSTEFHVERVRHLAATDPGGAWVAIDDEGVPVGLALALVREGIWGLSLFAVDERARGRGLGRDLLRAAWRHGDEAGAHGRIVLSSTHPAAMRAYATLGLDLHPVVDACGIPDLSRVPDAAARVTDGDVATADAIGREVRGAGHGAELELSLRLGGRLLAFEDRAFALINAERGIVATVAGRDEQAASAVLWGALAALRPGATAHVEFLDARQQWAIRTCLAARLPLSPGGALFRRGRLGPMTPYLPSGAWL